MFIDADLPDAILRGLILSVVALVWVIVLIRIVGLRSFSKMTNFDFVVTVAMGSLLAGAAQATGWIPFVQVLAGMAGLLAAQVLFARLRRASGRIEALIQNTPMILMRDGAIDEAALARTRVTRDDLIAKLREANVTHPDQVRAVVLETTGDISVLHGDQLDPALLDGLDRPDRTDHETMNAAKDKK